MCLSKSSSSSSAANLADEEIVQIDIPPSIYFGGCSWGAAFYIGVHRAMVENWGPDFPQRTLIAGDSAGTVIAILIALGHSNDHILSSYRMLASKVHAAGIVGSGSAIVADFLHTVLASPSKLSLPLHKQLSDNCIIGTTSFPCRHQWHSSWDTVHDLVDTVRGSFHIPFYSAPYIHSVRGEEFIDGAYGMAGTDLPHGDSTLFVGVDPHAEITRDLTVTQMLVPVLGKEFDDMVESGYNSFQEWVRKGGIMKKKSKLLFGTRPSYIPSAENRRSILI